MQSQDFSLVAAGEPSLLRHVELIVVESHRRLTEGQGDRWSESAAYHWLHYEDPDPVARLQEGAGRLSVRDAPIDGEAVDKACAQAREHGFSN